MKVTGHRGCHVYGYTHPQMWLAIQPYRVVGAALAARYRYVYGMVRIGGPGLGDYPGMPIGDALGGTCTCPLDFCTNRLLVKLYPPSSSYFPALLPNQQIGAWDWEAAAWGRGQFPSQHPDLTIGVQGWEAAVSEVG